MRVRNVIISAASILAFGVIGVESLDLIATHAIIEHQKDRSVCPHDIEFNTYDEWIKTVNFPYSAPDEKLRRVKENYARIGLGSSKREIVEAFGPPDYEREMIPKEPWRSCIGYVFVYYFEKPESNIVNEVKDKNIHVFFSTDGKADWIVGNVGLPEKGHP